MEFAREAKRHLVLFADRCARIFADVHRLIERDAKRNCFLDSFLRSLFPVDEKGCVCRSTRLLTTKEVELHHDRVLTWLESVFAGDTCPLHVEQVVEEHRLAFMHL